MARRLSTGLNEAIGLVTPNIANPFFASLAAAIEDECISHSYMGTLCSSNDLLERELYYLGRLATSAVDGLIFATNHAVDPRLTEALSEAKRPFVLIDEDIPGVVADRVFVDNVAGAKTAVTHLVEAGHQRIFHVGGPKSLLSTQERLSGWRLALKEHGLNAEDDSCLYGDYTLEFGRSVAERILNHSSRSTAIFTGSDIVAIGIMDEFRKLGIQVPRDMSIVGFDGMRLGRLMTPSLTSVRQPIDEMGKCAARMLLDRICGSGGEPKKEIFPVQLQIGGSVRQLN